eukprot:TRINITY_DN123349_c0_g1_i1.p1 TRINITY_DN123349_c0_g1~~TRINITY_DN123349_c0_g1_i1.p1  ORF type:complete len:138 (-),score=50.68 TRINITY_DN123349_c0_g1_i1:126-539(-)
MQQGAGSSKTTMAASRRTKFSLLSLAVLAAVAYCSSCFVPARSGASISAPRVQEKLRGHSVALKASSDAEVLPVGVEDLLQPDMEPDKAQYNIGFVKGAELLNSRAAMLGLFGMAIFEELIGKNILTLLGLEFATLQ